MANSAGRGRGSSREHGGAEHSDAARERLANNPFYVLELRPDCSRADVERQGQKLIGMLELELSGALRYRSPLGEHPRSSQLVRAAMAELRDPNRRLLHELWATLEPTPIDAAASSPASEPGPDTANDPDSDSDPDMVDLRPFPALRVLGFGDWSER
ncbi:hypothetical protein DB30_05828 [Enhygromyxa salina]|uniref:Uncharacterized protein n=1 Tax=Enhygromyxa salina TaxID=215803 RepID=A0A0C1ZC70_9BACT|nr:hypothetical protein [Enhygromyxa salina]KIG15284.1 hypothetical protein DB30_05828 [Enhygromyxa salina]